MSIWTMLGREIAYRKVNFLLGMLGVVVAIGILAGVLTTLSVHESRTEQLVAAKQAETASARAALATDVRKAMQRLGYNAIVLPKDQSLGDWYAEDFAVRAMPESWAERLAETQDVLDRYLPRLQRKIDWPERSWTVLVMGIGTERIVATSVTDESPLVEPIARGQCVVGHELATALDLQVGQDLTIRGRRYRIAACREELGTKEDITIWMSLPDAQELLDLAGQVNEIAIVEHLSVWGDIGAVRQQIAKILPEGQVVQLASETETRTHARLQVAEEAEQSLEQERAKAAALRSERVRLLAKLVPLGSILSAFWISLLTYSNVRERRQEMGLLLAIGFPLGSLRRLLLVKAMVLGAVGGAIGFLLGFGLALVLELRTASLPPLAGGLLAASGLFALGLGVLVSLFGSWLPILAAGATDPAVVLHEE